MKQVSQAYIDTINQDIRPPSQFRGTLKLRDDSVAKDAVVFYPTATNFSTGVLDNKHNGDYVALEQDFFQVGAGQLILPEKDDFIDSGYVSEKMANEYGGFPDLQEFTIEKKSAAELKKFNAVRYSFSGAYPKEIEVKVYLEGVLQKQFTSIPTGLQFTDNENHIPFFDKIIFTFKKLNKPNQRLRVNSIGFGDDLVFDMSKIISVTHEKSIDPASQKLPINKLTMTVENFDKQFDPDNPKGLYEYFERKQPFVVEYGVILQEHSLPSTEPEAEIEWVKTDTLLLSDKPKISKGSATFEATDVLSTLTWVPYVEELNKANESLYDLAEDILSSAGVTNRKIDTFLKDDYINTVLLPDLPVRELLQLIANASLSQLFCDEDGNVVIKHIPYYSSETLESYHIKNSMILDKPQFVPTQQLKNCVAKYYNNTVSEKKEVIFEKDVFFSGIVSPSLVMEKITFENATNLTVKTKNAIIVKATQTSATIICSGAAGSKEKVVIEGNKILTTTSEETTNFNPYGEDCIVENPLVTNKERAKTISRLLGSYYNNRYNYEMQVRQDFRLDCCDRIFIQTEFAEKVPAIITKLKFQWPGQKGSVTVRRYNK